MLATDIQGVFLDRARTTRTLWPGMIQTDWRVDRYMNDIATLLHRDDTTVAVVGATDDPSKYGSVIYRDLKQKGFEVYPVNPNRDTVDGDPAYRNLESLPVDPTIVNIVVPPQATLAVLKKAEELGHKNVWVQPGAESPEVMAYLTERDFNYLANSCIMVQSRVRAGA
jgi:uncharacterized protein